LAEVERECEPTYEDRRGSSGCCGNVIGELRVERLKSYEEAVDTGEVIVLWALCMLWLKGLEPRRTIEAGRE
jgi:hypothetical protein